MSGNNITRIDRWEAIIIRPTPLTIAYVAQEAGVERSHGQTSCRATTAQERPHCKEARNSICEGGQRSRSGALPAAGR
jgi:hypothetical protein